MQVTDELIDKLARLSRLHFAEAEKKQIRDDLQKMIAFVEKLNELDLREVEPLLHISTEKNIYRKDEVHQMVDTKEALKNAAESEYPFFKVPKMIRR